MSNQKGKKKNTVTREQLRDLRKFMESIETSQMTATKIADEPGAVLGFSVAPSTVEKLAALETLQIAGEPKKKRRPRVTDECLSHNLRIVARGVRWVLDALIVGMRSTGEDPPKLDKLIKLRGQIHEITKTNYEEPPDDPAASPENGQHREQELPLQ